MRAIWAFLRLVRLDSSVLGFLTFFVPLWARTDDLQQSFQRALPLLFMWICVFVANDLDDQDRDSINHPGRPLPLGELTATVAAVTYFGSLALALLTIKQYVAEEQVFWYFGVLATFISYHYIVEYLPAFKAVYVAGAIAAPIALLTRFFPEEVKFVIVAQAAFCFALGRELCMDVMDRSGDKKSIISRAPVSAVAAAAFIAHLVGLWLVIAAIRSPADWFIFIALAVGSLVAALCWFRLDQQRTATRIMKGQLLLGLFLLR